MLVLVMNRMQFRAEHLLTIIQRSDETSFLRNSYGYNNIIVVDSLTHILLH